MDASFNGRLADVNARIGSATRAAKRDPAGVTLIAVSKTFTAAEVRPALVSGQRVFGENRVQEAQGKWPQLRAEFPDLKLHLIGPLQSNKAAEAVALFDAIHTIDRPKIAKAVADEMAKQGRALQLFVQVNTGEEPQKAGVLPADAKAFVEHWCTEGETGDVVVARAVSRFAGAGPGNPQQRKQQQRQGREDHGSDHSVINGIALHPTIMPGVAPCDEGHCDPVTSGTQAIRRRTATLSGLDQCRLGGYSTDPRTRAIGVKLLP